MDLGGKLFMLVSRMIMLSDKYYKRVLNAIDGEILDFEWHLQRRFAVKLGRGPSETNGELYKTHKETAF